LDAIKHATKSLRIKMFVLSTDPSLIAAVVESNRRGVVVRVMLNPKRRNGVSETTKARANAYPGGAGVERAG